MSPRQLPPSKDNSNPRAIGILIAAILAFSFFDAMSGGIGQIVWLAN